MNRLCIALRNSCCFFLLTLLLSLQNQVFGQKLYFDTLAFYKHLKDENLLMEQVVFAHKLRNIRSDDQIAKDSMSLDIAAVYYKMNMPDSCIFNLKGISSVSGFSERKKELYFSLLLLFKESNMVEENIGKLDSKAFRIDMQTSFSMLKRQKLSLAPTEGNISPQIMDLKNRYVNTPYSSPFLAGSFSAILPGAGKWYVGYKRQALTAFIANTLFAVQAVESYSKAGISSPQFIITAGLFGIFYSGNIWGSILAAKKKKRDHLKEIDYEILGHYHTEFSKLSR